MKLVALVLVFASAFRAPVEQQPQAILDRAVAAFEKGRFVESATAFDSWRRPSPIERHSSGSAVSPCITPAATTTAAVSSNRIERSTRTTWKMPSGISSASRAASRRRRRGRRCCPWVPTRACRCARCIRCSAERLTPEQVLSAAGIAAGRAVLRTPLSGVVFRSAGHDRARPRAHHDRRRRSLRARGRIHAHGGAGSRPQVVTEQPGAGAGQHVVRVLGDVEQAAAQHRQPP